MLPLPGQSDAAGTQLLIECDERGEPTGSLVSRASAHTSPGVLHLAIALLLTRDGSLLLQHRRHRLFDDLWDVSGATHLIASETGAESVADAAHRCARDEWDVEVESFRQLGHIVYYADSASGCEREYCLIVRGEIAGEVHPVESVSYGARWIRNGDFQDLVRSGELQFSPWAEAIAEALPRDWDRMRGDGV
jgi:isopentenyldiphosphate isomerase